MRYWNELLREIINEGEVVIYGAGLMGRTVKKCLEEAPYYVRVKTFVVESLIGNPSHVDETSVIDIKRALRYRDALILVALHEKNMRGVLESLSEAGFRRMRPLSFDSDEWSDIRGNWFHYLYGNRLGTPVDLDEAMAGQLRIYVAQSVADHMLREEAAYHSFEIPIQVGAALTDKRIALITDDQGDSISDKNKKYCELTALYWIWKNDSSEYVGLSHYRRRFSLSEQIGARLPESDIDVVLTVPVINIAGVGKQYGVDHIASDWEVMMESVSELSPEYLNTADKVQKSNYYYAYNMLIARREILNQYCEWLFPILFLCENKIGDRQEAYQGRYLGFLAERLMTMFFERHKDELKIAIAKKHFISERG